MELPMKDEGNLETNPNSPPHQKALHMPQTAQLTNVRKNKVEGGWKSTATLIAVSVKTTVTTVNGITTSVLKLIKFLFRVNAWPEERKKNIKL